MRRLSPWLTALLQLAVLLSVVARASPWLIASDSPRPSPRHTGDIALRGYQPRPIYNGSVIPGGAYSLDELRRALARDPVAAHHYRDVKLEAMRTVTLTVGRAAYVSYRKADRIYWTRERVWLRAGETVLTDGTTIIRARCGNCVSDTRAESAVDSAHGEQLDDFVVPPTSPAGADAEPAEAEAGLGDLLEVPFAPQTLATLTPGGALLVPALEEEPFGERPFGLVPPIVLPGGGIGGTGDVPSPPGVTVVPGQPGGGEPPPPPPPPPPGFVPPGVDLPGTPDVSTGGVDGSTTTTGVTTATGTATTTGTVTTTTTGGRTSTGATSAPEPGLFWLVAAGLIGLARKKLRGVAHPETQVTLFIPDT
jgi:hypothetical protein